jgi:hypothetical protein
VNPGPESSREDQSSHRYGSFRGNKSQRERFSSSDGPANNHQRVHNSDSKDKDTSRLANEVVINNFRKFESEATCKGDLLDQSFDRRCATANSNDLLNMNNPEISDA